MKKILFGALALVIITCSFSFTDPVAKCHTTYTTNGDENGDACVSQVCTFKEKVNFRAAQWADCGNAQ